MVLMVGEGEGRVCSLGLGCMKCVAPKLRDLRHIAVHMCIDMERILSHYDFYI